MTLRGNTGDFPLDVVLRLLAETRKTGELTLHGGTRGDGALGLAEGRVVTAVFGDQKPIPALGSIWELGRVEFEFTPWNDAPPANLEGDLQDNLRKADEYKKWIESVRQVIPNDRTRFRLSERAAEQGAVTFTSDRWRVVLAVNGNRDVTQLAEHLKVDRDAALTTLAGLVRDGVIEAVEPSTEMAAPPTPSPPPAEQFTFPPPPAPAAAPAEPTAPARSEQVTPPPSEPAPPSPTAAAAPEPADWTAALVEKRKRQDEAEKNEAWTPPAPIADRQTWSAPPATPGTEEWRPPEPVAPEAGPAFDTSADTWRPPEPQSEPPQWTAPVETPETRWTPPEPQQEAPEWTAPVESGQEWTPPAPVEPTPPPSIAAEPAAPAQDEWMTPSAEQSSPALDDRLAALEGLFNPPAQPSTGAPPAGEWTTPSAPPAPAPVSDPRLSALSAPPPTVIEPAPTPQPAPRQEAASEWAPPPPAPVAPEKKRGIFGGLFGAKREDAPPAAPHTNSGASSRAGLLASLSNAMLNEYNSGQYGKTKVDDRIPSLLMRVDEQADPIDKPLPVIDDRLDVQALERVALPETQAVPYLAMLVSTIYADAEKAFGKDKARRGYKIAQMQVFHGDFSALNGLSGKLPKT